MTLHQRRRARRQEGLHSPASPLHYRLLLHDCCAACQAVWQQKGKNKGEISLFIHPGAAGRLGGAFVHLWELDWVTSSPNHMHSVPFFSIKMKKKIPFSPYMLEPDHISGHWLVRVGLFLWQPLPIKSWLVERPHPSHLKAGYTNSVNLSIKRFGHEGQQGTAYFYWGLWLVSLWFKQDSNSKILFKFWEVLSYF